MRRYGDNTWTELKIPLRPGYIERVTKYGSDAAITAGLTPIELQDTVKLIEWDRLESALAFANVNRVMPMFHQYATWAPKGEFQWNQDGIGYCWTWSGTAGLMDVRAMEGKPTVVLAPVSMGWLVDWADRGNYLESFIQGAREKGVAPAEYIPGGYNSVNRNYREYKDGWQEARGGFKLNEVWDTDVKNGAQRAILHCATILCSGRPLYIAYNWWSHALELVGMKWNTSFKNNVEWIIRNSHNEDDLISLNGDKGVPSEAYGFVSSQDV